MISLFWSVMARVREVIVSFLSFLYCGDRDKNMGLLVQFSTTFTSHPSAHNSHSAPELISLSNCIKLWGKLVLVQYDANIWCQLNITLVSCITTTKANLPPTD